MKRRPGKVSFFRLNEGRQGGIQELKDLFLNSYEHLQNREFEEMPDAIKIDDDSYYIQAMQRVVNENERVNGEYIYYWLITISRVDMSSEVVVADLLRELDERRRPIEHTETEGLVLDARLIFDPFREIIGIYSQRGTISTNNIRRFLCELVNVIGLRFEIILNENGYNRLNRLDIVKEISYKIASPNNFENYADTDRSELQDMKYANEVSAEEIYVVLKSDQLQKESIIRKVRSITENAERNIKALKVDGIVDGIEDTIDLIRNKLVYDGDIEYEDEIDDRAAYGFLNQAYQETEGFLFEQFDVVDRGEE